MKKILIICLFLGAQIATKASAATVTLIGKSTTTLQTLPSGEGLSVGLGRIDTLVVQTIISSNPVVIPSTFTTAQVSTLTVLNQIDLATTTFRLFDTRYRIFRFGYLGLIGGSITPSFSTESFFTNNYYFDGTDDRRMTAGPVTNYVQSSQGAHRFYVDGTGAAGSSFTATERFRIDNGTVTVLSSRMGIGTSSPQAPLQISSNTAAEVRLAGTANSATAAADFDTLTSVGTAQRWKTGTQIATTDGSFEIRDITHNLTNLQISTITTAVAITGTNTNDSAAAGYVGQYISSATTNKQAFAATTQYSDAATVSLTAGDWSCSAILTIDPNGATVTNWSIGISQTAGNSSSGLNDSNNAPQGTPGAVLTSSVVPSYRISLSATTSIYLKYRAVYTVAVPLGGGELRCRRER